MSSVSSVSSVSTAPPPPKKASTHAASALSLPSEMTSCVFTAPDPHVLKQALESGGASQLDIQKGPSFFLCSDHGFSAQPSLVFLHTLRRAELYPIPTRNLADLLDGGENASRFQISNSEFFSGHIRLDLSKDGIIGAGAFKTAQTACLTLTPLRSSGLGSLANHPVILKRPYVEDANGDPGPPFARYNPVDEFQKIYSEANVLFWAKALLKFVYDFISSMLNQAAEPPPFEIPQLRFVEAGVLLVFSDAPGSRTTPSRAAAKAADSHLKPSGTAEVMYLAEEVIPTNSDEDFVKYIHNGHALPCNLSDPVAREIAEFLSFTQHVQYSKSGGQVYISDYQGKLNTICTRY